MQMPEMKSPQENFETQADLIIHLAELKKSFRKDNNLDLATFNKRTDMLDTILSRVITENDKNPVVQYYTTKFITPLKEKKDKTLRDDITGANHKKINEKFDKELKSKYNEKNFFKKLLTLKEEIKSIIKYNDDIPLTVSIDTGKFGTKYSYHEMDDWGRITFENFINGTFPSRIKKYSRGMTLGKKDEGIYIDGEEYIIGPSSDRIYKGATDFESETTKAHHNHRILMVNALDKISELTGKKSFNVILCYSADQYGTDRGTEVALTVLNLRPDESTMDEINKLDIEERNKRLLEIRDDVDTQFPIKINYEKGHKRGEVIINDIITSSETLAGVLSPTVMEHLDDQELTDVIIKDIGGLNSTNASIKNGEIGRATIIASADGMIDVYSLCTSYARTNNSPTGGLSIKVTETDIERILSVEIPDIYRKEYDNIQKDLYSKRLVEVQEEAKEASKAQTLQKGKEIKIPTTLNSNELKKVEHEADIKALDSTYAIVSEKYKVLDAFFKEYLDTSTSTLHHAKLGFNNESTQLVFIGGGSSELRVFIYNYFKNVYPKRLHKSIVIPKDNGKRKLIYANAEGSYKAFIMEFSRNLMRRKRKKEESKQF